MVEYFLTYAFKTTVTRDTNLYTKTASDLIVIAFNMGAIGVLFLLGTIMAFLSVFMALLVTFSPILYVITNDINFKSTHGILYYINGLTFFFVFGLLTSGIPYFIHYSRLKEVYDSISPPEEIARAFINQNDEDEFIKLLRSLGEE